jgi:hypothetical protein
LAREPRFRKIKRMQFPHTMPKNENFDVLRSHSQNHVWELGIRRVMFGFRVCLSRVGDSWYEIDYCCGDDPVLLAVTWSMVSKILESIPEEATGKEVFKTFPYGEFKPIDRDPILAYLQKKAGIEPSPFVICSNCRRATYLNDEEKFCCGKKLSQK